MSKLDVEELIDRLQYVGNDQYFLRTNIIAAQSPLPRSLHMMQDPDSPPAAVMEELVRRGPACIAALCAHLSDGRNTRAIVDHPTSYSADYDWNPNTQLARPGVNSDVNFSGASTGASYAVTVGDLCFELLGRIVNRGFRASWYQPSMIIVVNSPVLEPALADAVRKEWARRTPEQLRQSLLQDASCPDYSGRADFAVNALWRYFPQTAAEAVRARLNVPTYDEERVRRFAEQLFADISGESRQTKITEFLSANPVGCRDGLLIFLWWLRSAPAQHEWKIPPGVVLSQLYGRVDETHPPLHQAVPTRSNEYFIEALADIPCPAINEAVYHEFERRQHENGAKRVDDDFVALACATHLAHTGHDTELVAYCRRRLRQATEPGGKETFQPVLDILLTTPKK